MPTPEGDAARGPMSGGSRQLYLFILSLTQSGLHTRIAVEDPDPEDLPTTSKPPAKRATLSPIESVSTPA